MSALEQQRAHYASVRRRLMAGKPGTVKSRRKAIRDRVQEAQRAAHKASLKERRQQIESERRQLVEEKLEQLERRRDLERTCDKFSLSGYAQIVNGVPVEWTTKPSEWEPVDMSMDGIAAVVLERWPGVSLADCRGEVKKRRVVKARWDVITAIARIRPDISYAAIGRFLNRHHTTILYALGRLNR